MPVVFSLLLLSHGSSFWFFVAEAHFVDVGRDAIVLESAMFKIVPSHGVCMPRQLFEQSVANCHTS